MSNLIRRGPRFTAAFVLLILSSAACGSATGPDSGADSESRPPLHIEESASVGRYTLKIEGDDYSAEIVADTVDTQWSESIRTIWLGTDPNDAPVGTLTMIIDEPRFNDGTGQWDAPILSAALSVTDSTVLGPGDPEGRSFRRLAPEEASSNDAHILSIVTNIRFGTNFVAGDATIFMEEFSLLPGDTVSDALYTVSGSFLALSD